MIKRTLFLLSAVVALAACSLSTEQQTSLTKVPSSATNYGLLVMAHGGTEQWNDAVLDSVEELRSRFPVEVAFGMADAGSLERSVRKLEAQNVSQVGVVRLFISGESWLERTQQILGMQDGAPSKAEWEADAPNRPPMRMPMGFWQIETDLNFHLSQEGLADAEEMDAVLLSRLAALSKNPGREVALVLAHGPGDDNEDRRWVEKISERTSLAKSELGLRDVAVFTLREDWAEKREQAEENIRDYVRQSQAAGFDILVVPYRVQGFGPYARVLDGLRYSADETGLLPHENVGLWIRNQALELESEALAYHQSL